MSPGFIHWGPGRSGEARLCFQVARDACRNCRWKIAHRVEHCHYLGDVAGQTINQYVWPLEQSAHPLAEIVARASCQRMCRENLASRAQTTRKPRRTVDAVLGEKQENGVEIGFRFRAYDNAGHCFRRDSNI